MDVSEAVFSIKTFALIHARKYSSLWVRATVFILDTASETSIWHYRYSYCNFLIMPSIKLFGNNMMWFFFVNKDTPLHFHHCFLRSGNFGFGPASVLKSKVFGGPNVQQEKKSYFKDWNRDIRSNLCDRYTALYFHLVLELRHISSALIFGKLYTHPLWIACIPNRH